MDAVIQKAIAQRDYHREQAERLEAFLATYFELSNEQGKGRATDEVSNSEKADAPKKRISRPRSGIGADTLKAAVELVREHGPLSTRDMLPMILAKGISVGGNDQVATLSARISNKGALETHHGKWRLAEEVSGSELQGEEDEAADTPTTETSAASFFSNQEGGETNAAPLN